MMNRILHVTVWIVFFCMAERVAWGVDTSANTTADHSECRMAASGVVRILSGGVALIIKPERFQGAGDSGEPEDVRPDAIDWTAAPRVEPEMVGSIVARFGIDASGVQVTVERDARSATRITVELLPGTFSAAVVFRVTGDVTTPHIPSEKSMMFAWGGAKRILSGSSPIFTRASGVRRAILTRTRSRVVFIERARDAGEQNPLQPVPVSVSASAGIVSTGMRFSLEGLIVPFTSAPDDGIRVSAERVDVDGAILERLPMVYSESRGVWTLNWPARIAGDSTFRILIGYKHETIRSAPVSLTVIDAFKRDSDTRFVRVSKTHPGRFELDDGTPFTPIGINLAWALKTPEATLLDQYARWLDECRDNGINLVRVWMSTWFLPPETRDGWANETTMRQLGKILDMAQCRHIRVMLVLDNYYDVRNHRDRHAFYAVTQRIDGDEMDAYFSDAAMRAKFKRRCRRLVARVGYHPALFAWELFNEIDLAAGGLPDPFTPGNDRLKSRVDWINEMAAYLKTIDTTGRPVTVSVSGGRGMDGILGLDALDFIQIHEYLPFEVYATSPSDLDEMLKLAELAREFSVEKKPVLIGEFGLYSGGSTFSRGEFDPGGIHMRHYLWASAFMPFAGTAMPWWWDSYIDGNGLFDLWKPVTDWRRKVPDGDYTWLNNFPLNAEREALPAPDDSMQGNRPPLGNRSNRKPPPEIWMTALKTATTVTGYLRDSKTSWVAVMDSVETGATYDRDILGATADIGAMPAGRYAITFIRPATGKRLSGNTVAHPGGDMSIVLPPFRDDLGFHVEMIQNETDD